MKDLSEVVNKVHCADAIEFMRELPDACVDSIVSDPPAGIGFMGKEWDKDKGGRDKWIEWMQTIAAEALRVIKPGGHALVWSLPRTSHWTATAWENGGWEVRDRIAHCFGSGFPKSANIQQMLNKAESGHPQGSADPTSPNHGKFKGGCSSKNKKGQSFGAGAGSFMEEQGKGRKNDTGPWSGWVTALKPAIEDWWLFRKPPSEKTIAANVLKHGVGGINVDGCRVEAEPWTRKGMRDDMRGGNFASGSGKKILLGDGVATSNLLGRFPANLIHDGSDEVIELFPITVSGETLPHHKTHESENRSMSGKNYVRGPRYSPGSSGSASRFFFCAKPSPSERHEFNDHPTVKSIALMRYLVRLITPPGAICLDIFGGSGSTAIGCHREGVKWIIVEQDEHNCEIARKRIAIETSQQNMHTAIAKAKAERA